MKKKRTIGITLLSIYLFLIGVAGLIYEGSVTFASSMSIFWCGFYLICSVSLFKLLPWGRKAVIILAISGIVYATLYNSPIYHQQRIEHIEYLYQNVLKDESRVSYSINNEKVTKKAYLDYRKQRIEKEKANSFNLLQMISGIILNGLLLLLLFKKSVKQQFELERL